MLESARVGLPHGGTDQLCVRREAGDRARARGSMGCSWGRTSTQEASPTTPSQGCSSRSMSSTAARGSTRSCTAQHGSAKSTRDAFLAAPITHDEMGHVRH